MSVSLNIVRLVIRNDGVTGSSPVCGTIYLFDLTVIFVRGVFCNSIEANQGTTA
jgi:hypothetical protein